MKASLICGLLLVCTTTATTAQNAELPPPPTVSHWSAGLKSGANYFRALPASPVHVRRVHWIVGGNIEYSINPLAGLGLEVMNNPYSGTYNNTSLKASILDFVPYFSIDLTNLLAPQRYGFWKKVNLYNETGGGYGLYNYSLNGAPITYKFSMLAKTGLNAEYRMNHRFSFSVEGQYRYYDRADLGGSASLLKGNCEAITLTLGLRYKFGEKSRPHARTISMNEYNPRPAPVFINKPDEAAQKAIADLSKKVQDLEDQLKLQALKKDMASPAKYVITSFQTIEFAFDSSDLTESSYPLLDQIAEILNNASWVNLKVSGNTDSTGPSAYNQGLSERRANTVRDYLVQKGIPASKMATLGNGENKPVETNNTSAGRQKNRRVDFEIVK
jgi:OOP family OmpA-OmpF porin